MIHRVTQYALDVVSGKIVSGKLQRLACQRHLNDLEKSKLTSYEYYFDEEKASELIDYAETLTISEGDTDEPLILDDFQAFIFGSLHGWVSKSTGYRRFRTSYIQVGRQQGKSLMNGVLGTFYGNFDGYKNGQIYCAATKLAQAKIVLESMMQFIRADKELEELFSIKEYKSTIECNITNSTIRALSRDSKIDGFRPLLGIVDEYHLHETNQMYKILEGGTGNLKECLISVITTAGFDLNSPCFQMYEYCVNVVTDVYPDETQFVFIAQLDEEDDIWNPSNFIKANPLTCKTQEGIDRMQSVAIKAKMNGGDDLKDFMTKRLNTWVQFSNSQYMNMEHWKKCTSDKTLVDFKGYDCIAGLDLSSGGDLTSLALVFPYQDGNNKKYFIHTHSFIPSNRVAEHIKTDNVPYDMWIRDGLLTATETLGGIKTDYKYIISYLQRLIDDYELNIKMICYDPANASAFLYDFDELGVDTLSVNQSARNLNDATVDFRLEVEVGSVEYNRNEKLLTWSMTNAKTESNSFGEIKVKKEVNKKRIDVVDAVIDAWKIAMIQQREDINITEVTDDYLDMMGW